MQGQTYNNNNTIITIITFIMMVIMIHNKNMVINDICRLFFSSP